MDLNTLKVLVAVSLPFILATFWAVLNAAQKDFGSIGQKAAWMLVAAIPFIGFIIYLLFGLRRGKNPDESTPS
jgi:uncharacterized membrane protein YhaH (DUF805 family)